MAFFNKVSRLVQGKTRKHGFKYEGFVGTRAGLTFNLVGTNHQQNSRTTSIAVDDIAGIKIAYANFYLVGNVETNNGAASTVTAAVEYPSGVFTQIPFYKGNPTGTVAAGGVLFSEYASVAIPKGATFWIRMFINNANGVFYNIWDNGAGGDLIHSAASGLSDLTMGGTISDDGTFSSPPFAIIGMTSKASVLLLGSSVIRGFNDTGTISDFRMGMIAKSFPNDLAFVNLSGDAAAGSTWVANTAGRKLLYTYASHAIFELTAVDLINGNSAASVEAQLATLYQLFGPRVLKTQMTAWPSSASSSNSFIDAAGQTAASYNAARVTLNTGLRAGPIPFLNNGIYEVAWVLEESHDSGKWVFDGTANKYTSDGIHPTVAGYDLIVSSGGIDTARLHYP